MSLDKQIKNTLIFTDLDATLLEHNSYSFQAAHEMLNFIKIHAIPLIIVTSKTKNEVVRIQRLLGITGAMIIENGAGIILPKRGDFETIPLGKDYKKTRLAFEKYALKIKIRGFYDMSVEEVAGYTKLPIDQASEAKVRLFTEPFVMEDASELEALKQMADRDGYAVVEGGRFYHLITKGQDKGRAIEKIIAHYENIYGCKLNTVALGDSANDLSMLKRVDTPILIPHPDGTYLSCDIPHLIKAPYPGPSGWNAALKGYFHVK